MTSTPYFESQLDQLKHQLTAWRRNGHQHHRTPETIWREAVELARALGISRVAQVLRLNYAGLKRRLTPNHVPSEESPPTFVELKGPPPVSTGECRICLQDRTGGQMSVVMRAPDTAVLRELAQVFWQRPV